jgi:hypothetical protein
VVFYKFYAWNRPGCVFDCFTFKPSVNCAFERYLIALHSDADLAGIQLGTSCQGFFYKRLDILNAVFRLYGYTVVDPHDPLQLLYEGFYGGFLVLPFHMPLNRYPSVLNLDLNGLLGNRRVPVNQIQTTGGDHTIINSVGAGYLHLELFGHGNDAFNALNCVFGGDFFSVSPHMPGKYNNAVFDGDTNSGSIDVR